MELQFQTKELDCLRRLMGDSQTREETQELKLSDGMPDIGRVLCAWGQYLIRGKEWQRDNVAVNGGVTVWILYAPDDGAQPQCVQSWIPMNFEWEIPKDAADGFLLAVPQVRAVDARPTAGRRLMIRATVAMTVQTYSPCKIQWHTPGNMPEGVYIKENVYPFCLVRDAGEKAFILDEELTLPPEMPKLEKLIRYSLQPEIEEGKVLGDKAIFRGTALIHILYRTEDGGMSVWDYSVPFSQYSQLRESYSEEAKVQVIPQVTAVELEADEQGRLRLKAGLTGQYLVYDTQNIVAVEDAYSPDREVRIIPNVQDIPAVLSRQSQRIRMEETGNFGSSQIVDVAFYPGACRKQRKPDEVLLELPGMFQALYYDDDGVIQAQPVNWQDTVSCNLADAAEMDGFCQLASLPQGNAGESSTVFRGEMILQTASFVDQQMMSAEGLEIDDTVEKDPKRPSVILTRCDGESIWSLAKKHGSTEQIIRQINHIDDEPEAQQLLLIPVL